MLLSSEKACQQGPQAHLAQIILSDLRKSGLGNNVGDLEIRDEYKSKAFSLIGRVNSEWQRLTISGGY